LARGPKSGCCFGPHCYRRSHAFVAILGEAGCAAVLIGADGPTGLPGVVRSVLAAVAAKRREVIVAVAVDASVRRR
jgi:hypothetical protein